MNASRWIAVGVGLLALVCSGTTSASAPELLAPSERAIFRDGPVDVPLTIASDQWPVWVEIDGELAGPRAAWPPPLVRLEPGMHRLRMLDRDRTHAGDAIQVAVFPPKRQRLTGRERNAAIAVIASLIALLGATLLRRRGL